MSQKGLDTVAQFNLDEINSTKSLEFADFFLVFIDAFELGNSIRPFLILNFAYYDLSKSMLDYIFNLPFAPLRIHCNIPLATGRDRLLIHLSFGLRICLFLSPLPFFEYLVRKPLKYMFLF